MRRASSKLRVRGDLVHAEHAEVTPAGIRHHCIFRGYRELKIPGGTYDLDCKERGEQTFPREPITCKRKQGFPPDELGRDHRGPLLHGNGSIFHTLRYPAWISRLFYSQALC